MIQAYLSNSKWTYASVYGLVWISSGLKLPTNLEENASDNLIKIYNEINTDQPLIIDFRNIIDAVDRALDELFKAFQTGTREVILVNYENIAGLIDSRTVEHYHKESKSICLDGGACFKILNPLSLDGNEVLESIETLRAEKIKSYVQNSFSEFENPKYLSSTPIKASGVYDASKIISNHTAFYWICLELSQKLTDLLNSGNLELKKEPRLLSVNLKSCPFASVVSLLNNIPLVTIDHLGPKHKVHDLDILDGLENHKQYSYIYIGDFCVGGTEIKIAKTYAGISNSDLNTAMVIGSYFDSQVFEQSFDLHALVSIENLHPKAKFEL